MKRLGPSRPPAKGRRPPILRKPQTQFLRLLDMTGTTLFTISHP
ncbi:hypothetical protein [Streptomyces sp. NPDC048606]